MAGPCAKVTYMDTGWVVDGICRSNASVAAVLATWLAMEKTEMGVLVAEPGEGTPGVRAAECGCSGVRGG